MRNLRTVKLAYEALPLPFDPSKLSYRDGCRDHGQLPRRTSLHWTVRYGNAFLLSSYSFLRWDISLRVEECSGTFFEASKEAGMLYLLPVTSVVDASLCACGPI